MRFVSLIKEFTIITAIYLGSEFIARHLGLPIPGNVLGVIVLAALLLSGVLKMGHVERAATKLLDNLALFFVPSGVGTMLYFNLIAVEFVPIVITIIVSTFLVIGCTGKFVELIIGYMEKRDNNG